MARVSVGGLSRALQPAGMAIIAASFHFVAWVFEFLALGRELIQFGAAALRQDGMAGIAVIGFDGALAVGGLVQSIMAPEAARPVFVANVVRIGLPTGLHLGEEVIRVDLLHGADRRPDARVVRITLGQAGSDTLQRLRLVGVGLRQHVKRVGFNRRR